MALNRDEVNALSVLKLRKLTFIPTHFARIAVSVTVDSRLIEQWIAYNLNSRYAIKKNFVVDQNKKMIEVLEIGMENSGELAMLSMGCPHLYIKKETY